MRLIACNGGSLKKGGSPSTISITIIPVGYKSTIQRNETSYLSDGSFSTEECFCYRPFLLFYYRVCDKTLFLPKLHMSTSGP